MVMTSSEMVASRRKSWPKRRYNAASISLRTLEFTHPPP
jgi:hypothetical protein